MSAADADSPDHREGDAAEDPPLTVELLADLQAGLLDDDAAARVRKQVRTDPQAQGVLRALNQVRRDVATAGGAPAPDPPPAITARISAALRSAGRSARPEGPTPAAHSARPPARPARVVAGVAGLAALVAAIALGTAALVNEPEPTPSGYPTASHITVSTPPPVIPLSDAQIAALLTRTPDYGPLGDPPRLASCLSGLGYPASTRVLGAQQVDVNARPGVLLVVPGDVPDKLAAFAVALNCSAADTGLLASTQVARP
jgi:hypothetical protein